jgi:hypothetical protein
MHSPRIKERGQVSLDLIVSVSLFFIFFIFVLAILSQFDVRFSTGRTVADLERKAIGISDLFVQGPGYPSGWDRDTSTAQVLGLSQNDHEVDANKVTVLKNLADTDYGKFRQLLGAEDSEVYFSVKYINASVIKQAGNFSSGTVHQIVLQRRVLYSGAWAILEVGVWHT